MMMGENNNQFSRLRRFHNSTGLKSHLMPASNRLRSLVKKKIKKIIRSKSRKSGGGRPNLLSNHNSTTTSNIGLSNNTLDNFNG